MRNIFTTLIFCSLTLVVLSQSNSLLALKYKTNATTDVMNSNANHIKSSRLKSYIGPFTETLDSSLTEKYDSTAKTWSILGKSIFAFDSVGNNTGYVSYWRQDIQSNWIYSEKEDYVYDANNLLLSDSYYMWDDVSKSWMGYDASKKEYTYNNNNSTKSFISSNWNPDSSKWIQAAKSDYLYDNNGNDTADTYSNWDYINLVWVFSEKTEKHFNSNNQLIQDINYDYSSSVWKYHFKDDYTLTNGHITQLIQSNWNQNSWSQTNKNLYEYDANGYPIHSINNNWNFTTNVWEMFSKDTLTVTTHGDILTKELYKWDDVNQKWIASDKSENIMDTTISRNTIKVQEGYYMNDKLLSTIYYGYDANNKSYQSNRSTYYYTKAIVLADNNVKQSVSHIYPNPNKGSFSVSFDNKENEMVTISIIDISGRIITKSNNQTIRFDYNENSLQPGIYFINVVGKTISYTDKMIITK